MMKMVNLNKLEDSLDAALNAETTDSLTNWIHTIRKSEKTVNEKYAVYDKCIRMIHTLQTIDQAIACKQYIILFHNRYQDEQLTLSLIACHNDTEYAHEKADICYVPYYHAVHKKIKLEIC